MHSEICAVNAPPLNEAMIMSRVSGKRRFTGCREVGALPGYDTSGPSGMFFACKDRNINIISIMICFGDRIRMASICLFCVFVVLVYLMFLSSLFLFISLTFACMLCKMCMVHLTLQSAACFFEFHYVEKKIVPRCMLCDTSVIFLLKMHLA